jgi:hypothetical protein
LGEENEGECEEEDMQHMMGPLINPYKIFVTNLKERDHFGHLDVGERIVLKWSSKRSRLDLTSLDSGTYISFLLVCRIFSRLLC